MNERVKRLKPSATVQVMDRAKRMRAEGIDIIDLGGGEPDFDSPAMAIEQAVTGLTGGDTHYGDSKGLLPLRQAIADKLARENNILVNPNDEIIVTPGGKYGLFLSVFTFLNPGDEVLIFDPAWVSYESVVTLAGARAVSIPLTYESNYQITEEAIRSKLTDQTKMMMINSPNNPTGRVLTDEEMAIVAKIVEEKDLLLVSDEIYERIVYGDHEHKSFGAIQSIENQVITINGFSKNHAMTGWRLGYLAADSELTKAMLKVHQHTITCVNSFAQTGAVEAMKAEDDILKMVKTYEERKNYLVEALNKIPGMTCNPPQGAFYALPQIDYKGMDSFELATFILEEGKVAVTPGEAFGQGAKGCVRLSFATDMENLEEAVKRLNDLFANQS